MPPRIEDETRAAILADVRDGELSAHAIARKHQVAQSTVSKIATQDQGEAAFDRSKTKKATAANAAEHQARLVAIAGRSAGVAEAILGSFEELSPEQWAKVSPHTRGVILGITAEKARDLAPADDKSLEDDKNALAAILQQARERQQDHASGDTA